jgi:hypothetical protein
MIVHTVAHSQFNDAGIFVLFDLCLDCFWDFVIRQALSIFFTQNTETSFMPHSCTISFLLFPTFLLEISLTALGLPPRRSIMRFFLEVNLRIIDSLFIKIDGKKVVQL